MFLLCDLQGGLLQDEQIAVIANPVIHSRRGEFGGSDLGPTGMSCVFASHECNEFCGPNWTKPRHRDHHYDVTDRTTVMY